MTERKLQRLINAFRKKGKLSRWNQENIEFLHYDSTAIHASSDLFDNSIIESLVKQEPKLAQYLSKNIRGDDIDMEKLSRLNPAILSYVTEELKNNVRFWRSVLFRLRHSDFPNRLGTYKEWEYVPENIKDHEDIKTSFCFYNLKENKEESLKTLKFLQKQLETDLEFAKKVANSLNESWKLKVFLDCLSENLLRNEYLNQIGLSLELIGRGPQLIRIYSTVVREDKRRPLTEMPKRVNVQAVTNSAAEQKPKTKPN